MTNLVTVIAREAKQSIAPQARGLRRRRSQLAMTAKKSGNNQQ
jgi:hypothetical protein